MSKRSQKAARQKAARQKAARQRPAPVIKRAFQGVVAVVGLLIALTQLVDWLEDRGTSPAALSADFVDIELLRAQLLREFLAEVGREPRPDETEQDLDQHGWSMRMRIRYRASPEQMVLVRWTLYDHATGRPVPGPKWSRVVERLRARAEARESDVPCWIPLPDVRRFFVKLTLETEQGRILASGRTRVVAVAARD